MLRRNEAWSSYLVAAAVVAVAFCLGPARAAYGVCDPWGPLPPGAIIVGDMNGDEHIGNQDFGPFLAAILDGPYDVRGDLSWDGAVDGLDVEGFRMHCPGFVVTEPFPALADPPTPIDGGNVFFSTVATVGGGVTMGSPDIVHDLGEGSGWLYIWSSDDQDFDTSIGMNIVSNTPDVIALTGAELFNSDIITTKVGNVVLETRWEGTSVNGQNPVAPDVLQNMNAVTIFSDVGVDTSNDGTDTPFGKLDTGYDVAAGALLLGAVQYEMVGHGVTHLSINQEGTALFVDDGNPIRPNFGTATIRVVPELRPILGDVNRDGQVNGLDVDPFVDRVVSGSFQFEADMNEDGWVDGLDVDLFIGGSGPLLGERAFDTAVVPEPSTLVTAILGLIGIMSIRRKYGLIGQHHIARNTSSKRKRVCHLRRNTLACASCLYWLSIPPK